MHLVSLSLSLYIYIFTNLISTSIHGTRKKQQKTLPGTRDKSISNHRPEEKEKNYGSKRKKRANLVRPLEKNQGVRSQGSKENQKPSANAAMLQLLKCTTQVEPIIKLT